MDSYGSRGLEVGIRGMGESGRVHREALFRCVEVNGLETGCANTLLVHLFVSRNKPRSKIYVLYQFLPRRKTAAER